MNTVVNNVANGLRRNKGWLITNIISTMMRSHTSVRNVENNFRTKNIATLLLFLFVKAVDSVISAF